MHLLLRLLKALPYLILSPILALLAALALAVCDLAYLLIGRRRAPMNTRPNTAAASVVIPNWNGRTLLEQYLPSVVTALSANPANEIIVVDNGSTDGSADFLRANFPQVRLLALDRNLGFGGGSNAGFRAASNDIVVLLNSDMRVDPGFLQPLLDAFTDDTVFAVSCQIFFSDLAKLREETGLTQGWWEHGTLRVRHRMDDKITQAYPCFYGGGGSCAFDRRKFLELGGFDELLAPFYLEDTDLGYLAWKRGWKVLYQPASIVFHEHRGTIGRKFTPAYIQSVLKKNFLLFAWKNMHEWRRVAAHLAYTAAGVCFSALFGDSPTRPNGPGLLRAARQLLPALRSRYRARSLATVSDTEAFLRPLGGYFRDRFHQLKPPAAEPRVLFVSPYPIYPPVHGGGVFMYQTVRELARATQLHLIVLLDYPHELEPHRHVTELCASAEYIVRLEGREKSLGSIEPHAVREFRNPDLEWLIHRQIYLHKIDVLQLEYTVMAQYAGRFRQIPSIVFEHDVYFQSIARGLSRTRNALQRLQARWEYLRALRFETKTLPHADRIQVCSRDNRLYLESFVPELRGRIDDDLRAGIDTSAYAFTAEGRRPDTMLFLGSFRHLPNQEALEWFIHEVLPLVHLRRPSARLIVIGSDPPPRHSLPQSARNVELIGFVEDIRQPLADHAVFICPILSGSGVRVKLLEAFAAGIPVVSTRLGAEGLAGTDQEICRLADDPQSFANAILDLLDNPATASAMAHRARQNVVETRDMKTLTHRLLSNYRATLATMRVVVLLLFLLLPCNAQSDVGRVGREATTCAAIANRRSGVEQDSIPPATPTPQKQTIIVTGTYSPIPLEESERTVRTLPTSRDRTLVNSVSEYLQMNSSVDLRRRAPGDIQGDLSIRGGTFSQTLVLLNGMRLNNAQTGHHTMDLPVTLDAISEIQILHGSGSTQYGSDAVTGVVNILVRPPETEARIRAALGNFGTNQQSGTVAFTAAGLTQSFVFSRDFSTGFMPNRDYRNLSLSSITNAETRLGATAILLAHSDRPFGAEQFYGNFNSWERTKGWFASLRQELGKNTSAEFAFRRGTDLFVLYRDRPQVFTNRHILESFQAALRRWDSVGTTSRLSYGLETYADRIDSNNLGRHSRARSAAYIAWDARVLRRFSFTAGLRDELWGAFNHQLSPTLSAGAWLNSRLKLRASLSRAFRVPTYTDLYYRDPGNIGDPNLRPERAWNYEAGADWHISDRIRAASTVFHRRDTDVIDYVRYTPNDLFRATNFQRLRFTGFEGLIEWTPARAAHRFSAQYTAMRGDREPAPGAISRYIFNYPIHSGVLTWQGSLGPQLAARTRIGVMERSARAAYAVWDIAAARSRGRIRPFLQFNNLTSTLYQEIPGVAMPPRTVLAGLELKWNPN